MVLVRDTVLIWVSWLLTSVACSWVDVTEEAQLPDAGHRLMAFGDFNADRRTDLFLLDGESVVVYLADDTTFSRSDAACKVQV
jgi:hypothetical protein